RKGPTSAEERQPGEGRWRSPRDIAICAKCPRDLALRRRGLMVKRWPRVPGEQHELLVELHQGSWQLPGTGANAIGHVQESGKSDEISERLHIAYMERAVLDIYDVR